MTEAGRRELVQLKLQSADRKLREVGQGAGLTLVGSLALEGARKALAESRGADAKSFIEALYRDCKSFWYRGAIKDAVQDIREAVEISRQPIDS